MMSANSLPAVWRIHIRPGGGPESSGENAVALCLDQDVVGIGWQVSPTPRSAEEYFDLGQQEYGTRGWKTAANAIVRNMAVGDLAWFRDIFGVYYIARVCGGWEYRDDPKNEAVDIVNVRPCEIHRVGTRIAGNIISNFIRGQTVRRIADNTARLFSVVKFNEITGQDIPVQVEGGSIFSLLSAKDLEDLVGLYLQRKRNLLLIPGSQQPNSTTIAYEFELVDPNTGHAAYVQVKSGHVRLDPAPYYEGVGEEGDRKYYLFSPAGYQRPSEHRDVICLEKAEIEEFVQEARNYLPANIRTWVDWLDGYSKTA